MCIKTFVDVEQSEYQPGDKIKIERNNMSQKI
jgi:hypothetical protein